MEPLLISVTRNDFSTVPEHHAKPELSIDNHTISLTDQAPSNKSTSGRQPDVNGRFQNPPSWRSWRKPGLLDVAKYLEWGEDLDPCIQLAAKRIPQADLKADGNISMLQKARALLSSQKPDFAFVPTINKAAVTWLGHAGILVQLPPLLEDGRPIRCLFDPIFSMRASPTQQGGPIRTYPAPCEVADLPPVDLVFISHNHFDHCDFNTIKSIWDRDKAQVQFLVPLGNRSWFVECGIAPNRVTEFDWWESALLSLPGSNKMQITCTPSQHNSGGRKGGSNATLWASWYVEQQLPNPFRVFFAGDTGYQFHASAHWPPSPDLSNYSKSKRDVEDSATNGTEACCPAFTDIAARLGAPDLLILPVAVGATFDYMRSWMPLAESVNPFPRHKSGLTAANHMPPWDAVRVLRLMTDERPSNQPAPIAVAMHWGTFVPNPSEVLKTLGNLEWACDQHGVQFGRELLQKDSANLPKFLALNHGQSILI